MKKYILILLFVSLSFLCFASSPNNINFSTGKSDLLTSSIEEIEKIVVWMTNYPQLRLELRGHTDAFECRDSLDAIRLGWERAYNVQQYLAERGIDKCRIPIHSFGRDQPTVPNMIDGKENLANKAINRRVEFIRVHKEYKLYTVKKVYSADSLLKYSKKFREEYKFLKGSHLVIFVATRETFSKYMASMGRYLVTIKLSKEDNYLFSDTSLLSELVKQNVYLGMDYAYYLDETKIDKQSNFFVCVLEWICEE